jgi:hypothetical protein
MNDRTSRHQHNNRPVPVAVAPRRELPQGGGTGASQDSKTAFQGQTFSTKL